MYAITYNDKAYGPSGVIKDTEGTPLDPNDVLAFNATVESKEINAVKAGADRLFLYIGHKPMDSDGGREHDCVQTWLGTWLGWAWLGPRAYTGFGHNTYRRPVTVRMFGTLYHGWYMESSGDYCRLKKAKNQAGKYAATQTQVKS